MITDFIAQQESQHREYEVVQTAERRRVAAERAAAEHFNGDRLALMAHIARQVRATRAIAAKPIGC